MNKTKERIMKIAAIAAAITLTAGMPLGTPNSADAPAQLTAYANTDFNYTSGTLGAINYAKYTDHIEITGCADGTTSLEIPDTIDGLPVTAIQMYAFQLCSLKTLTLPDSITRIGGYAFGMSSELTTVKLPANLEVIELHAFEMCHKLETIEFPDHTVEIHSKAFDSTPWLDAKRKENPLVIINGTLLDGTTAKGDIVIPDDVKYVSSSAFARNSNITSVIFPPTINKISDNTFFFCDNLTSVEAVGATAIESMAFAYCNKLSSLKLSNKLKTIDSYAFSDITNSATITFCGTKEDWDKVEKSADDKFLNNAKLVFEDAPPVQEILYGDTNCDGKVLLNDAVLILQYLGNPDQYQLNEEALANADVCNPGDGITNKDALSIQRYTLNLISELPEQA